MDEPLAALDLDRKREIIPYIERLRDELKLPVIYVSHAIDEVARLADHVVALDKGHVVGEGTPAEILQPRGVTTDRFTRVSVLSAHGPQFDAHYGLTAVMHPAGPITLIGRLDARLGVAIRVVIRATDVTLALAKPSDISLRTMLKGRVSAVSPGEGAIMYVDVELDGGDRLAAAVTRKAVDELGLDHGDQVYCLIKAVSIDERLMLAP